MEKLETFPKVRALPGVSHAGGEGGENATDSQQDQLICQLLLKSHFDRLSGCVFVSKLEGGSDGRAQLRSQETGVRSQNQRRFETRTRYLDRNEKSREVDLPHGSMDYWQLLTCSMLTSFAAIVADGGSLSHCGTATGYAAAIALAHAVGTTANARLTTIAPCFAAIATGCCTMAASCWAGRGRCKTEGHRQPGGDDNQGCYFREHSYLRVNVWLETLVLS